MTPQEELFAKLFNHEQVLVKDMDILTLRAHREELASIAFEARARLTAVDEEEKSRKKKDNNGKPTGFARSVNSDSISTELINTVKERQKGLTKKEKLIDGLVKLGYTRSEAEKKVSAGELLTRMKQKITEEAIKASPSEKAEPEKEFVNPFAKKKKE